MFLPKWTNPLQEKTHSLRTEEHGNRPQRTWVGKSREKIPIILGLVVTASLVVLSGKIFLTSNFQLLFSNHTHNWKGHCKYVGKWYLRATHQIYPIRNKEQSKNTISLCSLDSLGLLDGSEACAYFQGDRHLLNLISKISSAGSHTEPWCSEYTSKPDQLLCCEWEITLINLKGKLYSGKEVERKSRCNGI